MNHPDGDCLLFLNPLLDEDAGGNSLSFMKLMSCFHCFHCDCILRWWNWVQVQSEKEIRSSSSSTPSRIMQDQKGMLKMMEESMEKCPVCHKVFLAKDIEHVLDLVETGSHLVCQHRCFIPYFMSFNYSQSVAITPFCGSSYQEFAVNICVMNNRKSL
ncbi:hypothetical protein CDL12_28480 [Handroanthus impetiginosus]|uniref:RING-type domain-containing protein n=1 Tax=Handroanthus impetiginosus TaxID=429701 RepID=A0A2G9G151_9LAMI|nr:hypothetical protein CDL12_28480 [Handroanthus impetiginosus]